METTNTLPPGRVCEKEIFGTTDETSGRFIHRRKRRGIKSSMQDIIQQNWAMYAEALERGSDYYHNPSNPEMAKTHLLWKAVKECLPRRVGGYGIVPLNLYVAIGRNSLDREYGVDAFFWWQEAYVTIDLSMFPLELKKDLKADFLLNPEDMETEKLSLWGKKIAELLKTRSHLYRRVKKKKKRLSFEE